MNEIDYSFLNDVKNRFLPLPRSAVEGLEHEPKQSDFEFIEELGEGTFGTVYLASHKKTKAKYAIKSIDKSEPENLAEKKNFNREVEIMYKLNHPNIVKLYEVKETPQYFYLVTEYCNGGSLSDLLEDYIDKNNSGFPEKIVQYLMKQIVEALKYLHAKRILHRDIKLDNILVHFENEEDRKNKNMLKAKVKIIDFGFARYLKNEE